MEQGAIQNFLQESALQMSYTSSENHDRKKFRSQTSDNMDRWKYRGGKSHGGEEKEVRRSEKRKREKKEDASARKGRKVAIHCVFSNDLWLRRVEKLAR